MNPIIFLDIDGVLNPNFQNNYDLDLSLHEKLTDKFNDPKIKDMNIYFLNQIYFGFDKKSCGYIKVLVDEFDAKIVLTSSWRVYYTKDDISNMFKILGIDHAFFDFTDAGNPRTEMIKKFVEAHKISNYIVIDDFDMTSAFGYRFIHTSHSFNEANFHKAKYVLRLQG